MTITIDGKEFELVPTYTYEGKETEQLYALKPVVKQEEKKWNWELKFYVDVLSGANTPCDISQQLHLTEPQATAISSRIKRCVEDYLDESSL